MTAVRNQSAAASAVAVASPCVYFGFSIRETTGTTAAVVRIYDNASAASGMLLDSISLVAGESAREFYGGDDQIRAVNGVYVSVVSGTVEGVVRVGF